MFISTAAIGGGRLSMNFLHVERVLPIDLVTQTITSVPFGPANGRRTIIVGITANINFATQINAVTIGGVAASRVCGIVAPGELTDSVTAEIWKAQVPAGTSGTVTFSVPAGDIDSGSLYVWNAYHLKFASATDTDVIDTDYSVGAASLAVDVLAGGFVIAVSGTRGFAGPLIFAESGFVIDAVDDSTTLQSAAGHQASLAAETPRSLSLSAFYINPSKPRTFAAASFR